MEIQKPIVDRQIIVNLLSGDEEFVREFAVASVDSFSEFKREFGISLNNRDEEHLRKVGHKIKPVAQMMQLEPIITMYESSKIMLQEDAPEEDIKNLIHKMNDYCNELLKELKELK